MSGMKAIETRYKGYRFRSRLEARWAVFFDSLGVYWEYEREGFSLGNSGFYLPDFWIGRLRYQDRQYPEGNPPTPGWYVEIKPVALSDREESLCRKLAVTTKHVVYALAGNVGAGQFASYKYHPSRPQFGGICQRPSYEDGVFDSFYNDPFLFYLCSDATPKEGDWAGRAELDAAFAAARSARFEHGESPQVRSKKSAST